MVKKGPKKPTMVKNYKKCQICQKLSKPCGVKYTEIWAYHNIFRRIHSFTKLFVDTFLGQMY